MFRLDCPKSTGKGSARAPNLKPDEARSTKSFQLLSLGCKDGAHGESELRIYLLLSIFYFNAVPWTTRPLRPPQIAKKYRTRTLVHAKSHSLNLCSIIFFTYLVSFLISRKRCSFIFLQQQSLSVRKCKQVDIQ